MLKSQSAAAAGLTGAHEGSNVAALDRRSPRRQVVLHLVLVRHDRVEIATHRAVWAALLIICAHHSLSFRDVDTSTDQTVFCVLDVQSRKCLAVERTRRYFGSGPCCMCQLNCITYSPVRKGSSLPSSSARQSCHRGEQGKLSRLVLLPRHFLASSLQAGSNALSAACREKESRWLHSPSADRGTG